MVSKVILCLCVAILFSIFFVPEIMGEELPLNNLSFPVIWSDGVTKPLRGDPNEPVLQGQFMTMHGFNWFYQQDENNLWQADSEVADVPVEVNWIDWGDNLEAKPWYASSVVRTEVVLYKDLTEPMNAFEMLHLFDQGPDEMWGSNGVQYNSYQATVYSGCARLTIQKLTADPNLAICTWDPANGKWTGDITEPFYNSAVWETQEGSQSPEVYKSELNIPGKVIYGYNWNIQKTGDGTGYYRLTFSFDGEQSECPVELNTFFVEGETNILQDYICSLTTDLTGDCVVDISDLMEFGLQWLQSSELPGDCPFTANFEGENCKVELPDFAYLAEDWMIEGDLIAASDGSPSEGGTAVIDFENNLTYIDVTILP